MMDFHSFTGMIVGLTAGFLMVIGSAIILLGSIAGAIDVNPLIGFCAFLAPLWIALMMKTLQWSIDL